MSEQRPIYCETCAMKRTGVKVFQVLWARPRCHDCGNFCFSGAEVVAFKSGGK